MAKERYIVIQESMLALGLNANELIAYALIYGFCQDDATGFRGSIDYVAGWCRVQRRQAIYILKSLVEKGVVTKQEIPGQTCAYFIKGVQPTAPVQKIAQGGAVHCMGGVQPTAPNNLSYKLRDNIDTHSSPRAREDKVLYGDCVLLTEAEHARLVQRYGDADTARLIEILDLYLANKTKDPYKSHYAAIQKWVVRDLAEQKTAEQRLKNAQEAAHRVAPQQQGPPPGNYAALAEARARREAIEAKYKLPQ